MQKLKKKQKSMAHRQGKKSLTNKKLSLRKPSDWTYQRKKLNQLIYSKLKEAMSKELEESLRAMFHQLYNINKQLDIIKKGPNRISELEMYND